MQDGRDHRHRDVHRVAQYTGPRGALCQRRAQRLVENHQQQFVLGGRVAEQRARADVGTLGDCLRGDAGIAMRLEQLCGGLEDAAVLVLHVAVAPAVSDEHISLVHEPS